MSSTEFGCALGAEPTVVDEELNQLKVAVLPLTGGEFYHFGTTHELLSSTMAIQNLVNDQREIMHHSLKPHPSMFVQNADTKVRITADNSNLWIENSCVPATWTLAHENVITGVPQNTWNIDLLPGQCIDMVPVGDVVAGEHYNDTINSAQIIFRCFASEAAAGRLLSVPQNIVMVRKADMYKFFEKENLPDSKTSYISVYDASNNAYSFANIGQLLTILKNERDAGAGVVRTESEEVRNAKYAQWEAANPDWNKVILIPVQADYTTTTNIYGVSTKTLQRVRNLMGMTSVKIEGGAKAAPQMSVVYSRFKK